MDTLQTKSLIILLLLCSLCFGQYANNSYLTFNGSSAYADVLNDYRSGDSAGSIVAWVKVGTLSNMGTVFSFAATTASTRYIYFGVDDDNSGEVFFQQRDNDTACRVISATTTVSAGTDFFIAVTTAGAMWGFNINGINQTVTADLSVNNGDWFAETNASSPGIALGRKNDSTPDSYFNGIIYQVAVYSDSLTAAECLAMYNAGTSGTLQSSGRVGYWKINEGSGSTLADTDGAVDLTITDATWTTVALSTVTGFKKHTGWSGKFGGF